MLWTASMGCPSNLSFLQYVGSLYLHGGAVRSSVPLCQSRESHVSIPPDVESLEAEHRVFGTYIFDRHLLQKRCLLFTFECSDAGELLFKLRQFKTLACKAESIHGCLDLAVFYRFVEARCFVQVWMPFSLMI